MTRSRAVRRSPSADAARLGEPSYVWRSGQERRLQLILDQIPLRDRRILDVGCGIGTYVRRFRDLSSHVFGLDVSAERLGQAGLPGLVAGEGEALPFSDGSFDVIVFNEVIEHVRDDRQTIRDALRALSDGGHIVIYAPNRLYPFETHGVYIRGRYKFGNIPLVNYLPDRFRRKLVPHARAYTERDIARLWERLPVRLIVHTYVYPGFDNVAARSPRLGAALRRLLYGAEHTPVRRFGLSHFVVLEKVHPRRGTIEAGARQEPAQPSILRSDPSV